MLKIIRQHPIFIKYPIAKEFTKFCLVGFSNLAIDFLVYIFFTRLFHFHYLLAAVMSFVVAVTWSFYLNRAWTFRQSGHGAHIQYSKFIIANLISLAVNLFLFHLFIDYGHLYDLLAKLLVSVIVAFLNFSLNKFWTFKENNPAGPDLP